MDSFMVTFVIAYARVLLASHSPRVSGAMHCVVAGRVVVVQRLWRLAAG